VTYQASLFNKLILSQLYIKVQSEQAVLNSDFVQDIVLDVKDIVLLVNVCIQVNVVTDAIHTQLSCIVFQSVQLKVTILLSTELVSHKTSQFQLPKVFGHLFIIDVISHQDVVTSQKIGYAVGSVTVALKLQSVVSKYI